MFVKVGGFAHAWLDFIWFDVCITGLLTLAGHIFLLSDTSNVKRVSRPTKVLKKVCWKYGVNFEQNFELQKNEKILEERIAGLSLFGRLFYWFLLSILMNSFVLWRPYTSSFLSSHPTHIYIYTLTRLDTHSLQSISTRFKQGSPS